VKDARNDVDSFKSECEQNLCTVLLAKDRVVQFQEGPLATFMELRELSPVSPIAENIFAENLKNELPVVPEESSELVDTHMLPLVEGPVEGVAAPFDTAPDAEDNHAAMDVPGADDGPDANGPPCAQDASTEAPSSHFGPVAPPTSSASEGYDEMPNLKSAPINKDEVGVADNVADVGNAVDALITDGAADAGVAIAGATGTDNVADVGNANVADVGNAADALATDSAANAGATSADNVADVDNAADVHDAVAAHISDCRESEAAPLGPC